MISALKERREKRDPLNVIPMGVREKNVSLNHAPVRALDERAAEFADPGSCIENHQPAGGGPHFDARRVAAVPHRALTRAGNRAPRAPKLDPQAHLVSLDTKDDST